MDTKINLKVISNSLIILLSIILLISIIINASLRKKINVLSIDKQHKTELYHNLVSNYVINSQNCNFNDIPRNIELTDIQGKKLTFADLTVLHDSLIIFRYNERSCYPCITSEIETIIECLNENIINDIVILCNFIDFNDFITFSRINQLGNRCFLIKENVINNYYEEKALPYYLFYERNKLMHLFLPFSKDFEITRLYFQFVSHN